MERLRHLALFVGPGALVFVCTLAVREDPWERRQWRQVTDARWDPERLLDLGVALPVVPEGAAHDGRPLIRVVVAEDGVTVDYAGWLLALPHDTRRSLRADWEGRGLELGPLGEPAQVGSPADGLRMPALTDALLPRRELQEHLGIFSDYRGENERMADDLDELLLLADGALPYGRVVPVLYTAFTEGIRTIQVGVDLPEREGVGRLAVGTGGPWSCLEADAPSCQRVVMTLRAAPARLEVAASPGECIVEPPPACAPGAVGPDTCAVIPATNAAIQGLRASMQALPACDTVIIAAEADVPWAEVVQLAAGVTGGAHYDLGLGLPRDVR